MKCGMKILSLLKKRWYVLAALVVIIGAGVYIRKPTVKGESTETYTVRRKALKEALSLSGSIDASEHVSLRFQSAGKLTYVGVKEGDYVQKGQLIASLDQRELQKRLTRYLNTYSSTRLDFDQQQDDNKTPDLWSLTDDQRRRALRIGDKSQNSLNNSVIDVELQALALEYSNLTSPIDGLIVRIDTPTAGVNITPASAEFEIVNPNTLYFVVDADQTEVTNLYTGQPAEIVFDAYQDKKVVGNITSISFMPKSGETGTVYEVKLTYNQHAAPFRYGMTGDATFVLKERANVLVVPSSFVFEEGDKKYVWRDVNGKREKTFVTVGETVETDTEIKGGIHPGDLLYQSG